MRVTQKGQVTIPLAVRRALGIHPGSEVPELTLVRTDKVGSPDRTEVLGRYKLPAH